MILKIENQLKNDVYENEKRCVGCNACMKGCPMLDIFCDSPKTLLESILKSGEVSYNLMYACTNCGYCSEVCKAGVKLDSLFMQMRTMAMHENEGKLPSKFKQKTVANHQKNSFSPIFSTSVLGESEVTDTVFFPGCSLMAYSPQLVDDTYQYLKKHIPQIGIYLKCCAKPTIAMGDIKKFKEYSDVLKEEFEKNGVKRIITACPNCYNTLSDSLNSIKIESLWEVISEFGIPQNIKGKGLEINANFALHDPCASRDLDNTHKAVRQILEEIGINYKEMKYNKRKTLCCGSGGMVSVTSPVVAQNQNKRRAMESDAEYMITYCQECVQSLERGGKKSIHLLDLLFDKSIYNSLRQKKQSSIKHWHNRYIGKKIIERKYNGGKIIGKRK